MRVLVTGASGFVGLAVARQLSRAGHDIVVLLRQPGQLWCGPAPATNVYGDVRDAEAMRRAVEAVDAVCHLAALTRVRESLDDLKVVFVGESPNLGRSFESCTFARR